MSRSADEAAALIAEAAAQTHERAAEMYESWVKGWDGPRDEHFARRARALRELAVTARSPDRLAERALQWFEARIAAGRTSRGKATSLRTLAALERLRALTDQRIEQCVAASRRDGATWAEIAAALRMRRQSAHQRFR